MKEIELLKIRNISIDFGKTRAVDDVSFVVKQRDFITMIGRSGCGKSTLLKAVGGFLPKENISQGEILLNDKKITRPGPDRMVVWQDLDQLFPWKTIEANVAYPLIQRGDNKKQALEIAKQWIEKVGLARVMGRFPHELSGGQKQRVAIARGLAANPAILLMDEPFSALDALTRSTLQDELLKLHAENGTTFIFVTHDIEEAAKLGTHIVALEPHPGRIKAIVPKGTRTKEDLVQELNSYIHEEGEENE